MVRRKDWNLLVISAAKGEDLTPVQLQKALFLLGETVPTTKGNSYYEFKAYNYGPFSQDVYRDAEALAEQGLVDISVLPGDNMTRYKITPAGMQQADILRSDIGPSIATYVDGVVAWIRSLSFRQLLSYIYQVYPQMAVNSMFKVK